MLPVYLVEDDPTLRASVSEAINTLCDAEIVGTAESETEAVLWLNENQRRWKLAILDLFLKEGTGFGILQRMVPVALRKHAIVLTNSATPENRSRCLALGALAVYDKTTQFEEFLAHCLRHPRMASVVRV